MFIMLTNDDGIHAGGLRALYRRLRGAGHEVAVVAPLGEQSSVGHSITVLNPLRVKTITEADFSGFAVSGTPTDCVKLGLSSLLDKKPDLVVSGMNAGGNLGPDVLYSGTVAAATEAAAVNLPSLAVSHCSFQHLDLDNYAGYAVSQIARIPWKMLPERLVLNLNLPACPFTEFKGLRICPQTDVSWDDWYIRRADPRGGIYYWLEGRIPMEKVLPGTDKYETEQGFATLTPLRFDFTDWSALEILTETFPADD
jgi:5'-nucleotidase